MGLDVAVYSDDLCENGIAAAHIGNLDGVVFLRKFVEERHPDATVLLTKVLYSAFHCGDSLDGEDLARAKIEIEQLADLCPEEKHVQKFVDDLGRIIGVALTHRRPVTFT